MPQTSPSAQPKSRFEPIKASISFDKNGRPQYGLPDGPARPSLTYAFQQAKAAECEAAAERMAHPPSGRRTAARADLESQWAAQNEQPHKVRPRAQLALLTSPANPLAGGGYAGWAAPGDQQQELQGSGRAVYYPKGLPPSLREHLGVNLVPVEEEEGQQQQGAGSPGAVKASGGGSGGGAAGTDAVQEAEARQERLKQLREKLCVEYPHGVPKLILKQLELEGEVPSVGFSAELQAPL